jgi:hypothetical protein
MQITHDDLVEWKQHPVTQRIFQQVTEMVADQSINLVMNGASMDAQAMKERAIEIATVFTFVKDAQEVEIDDLQ